MEIKSQCDALAKGGKKDDAPVVILLSFNAREPVSEYIYIQAKVYGPALSEMHNGNCHLLDARGSVHRAFLFRNCACACTFYFVTMQRYGFIFFFFFFSLLCFSRVGRFYGNEERTGGGGGSNLRIAAVARAREGYKFVSQERCMPMVLFVATIAPRFLMLGVDWWFDRDLWALLFGCVRVIFLG